MARKDSIEADGAAHEAREALARLHDENALLRAALADARTRLDEAGDNPGADPLTALLDARQLVREIERVLSKTARHGTPAALLSVEIDELANLNERYGRVAGDAAIRHVARQLKTLIRSSDIAARNGGGSFSLLLDHLDADSALDTAERIAHCIAAHPLDLGHAVVSVQVTASVASILPGDTVEELLRRAARNRERVKEF